MSEAILDYTKRGANKSSDTEDSEDEILKDLTDHVTDCACFSHMPLVLSKSLGSALDIMMGAVDSHLLVCLELEENVISEAVSLKL